MKVDMSDAAVTARLKRACGLGDAEWRATMIRKAMAEVRPESDAAVKPKNKKPKHASFHS